MLPKLNGCCSKCDTEVFEIKTRYEDGRPKQTGAPLDNGVRVGFLMVNGSVMDLTFCQSCIDSLQPSDYLPLWHRVLLSWGKGEWATSQADNGLSGILYRTPWKDVPL